MNIDRSSYLLSVLAGISAGLLLSVIVRVNATLGEQVGEVEATFLVHLVGTLFAVLIVLPRLGSSFWGRLRERPWREWTGGLLSVAMVWVANVAVPALGTALAVSLFVAGDLFFSSVVDQSGRWGLVRVRLSPRRIIGLLLALAGVLLVHWG
ncbi:MAG: DMT family transporter [Salinibacter sp.]